MDGWMVNNCIHCELCWSLFWVRDLLLINDKTDLKIWYLWNGATSTLSFTMNGNYSLTFFQGMFCHWHSSSPLLWLSMQNMHPAIQREQQISRLNVRVIAHQYCFLNNKKDGNKTYRWVWLEEIRVVFIPASYEQWNTKRTHSTGGKKSNQKLLSQLHMRNLSMMCL